ncbi:hypothetical protein KR038_008616 [Drosophila bunnanda]|nr:hypothetical protein KR038_008616 [Drosophila bunnanda]
MSGFQGTNMSAGPLPVKETIYISTAPPPEPAAPPSLNVTVTNRGYWASMNRQTATSTAVFFFFVYGGMDFAASLGWDPTFSVLLSTEFSYCWFIGVIIGALAAMATMTFMPKQVYYVFGGLMQLIGSIIFTAAPADYSCCLAARYVAGVGIGLITVPFIIHNAEVAGSNKRGATAGLEQCGLAIGIAAQVVYTTEWLTFDDYNSNLVHGILGIVFSLLGLATSGMAVESPVFFLQRNQEQKARSCQLQLVGNNTGLANKYFDEARIYVVESSSRSLGEELVASAMPFVKLLLFRCCVAFSFSLPLTSSIIYSSQIVEGISVSWQMYVWSCVRLIGTLVALCFLDTIGRKAVSLVGLLCMAGLMLGMAGLYDDVLSFYSMAQICNIGIAFQAFAGLFVCSSSVYLGEAFPLRLKPYLVGLIVIVEQVIHVIVIACIGSGVGVNFFAYFLAVGIIMLLCVIFFAVSMPETKKMTLREAGHRFQKWYDVTIY